MADFSNIENQIDNAITTNGVGAITGAILNAILKGMLSAVDAAKEDTLTFDLTPTAGSTKPVTSGGVYDALDAAAQAVATTLTNYYTKTQADSLLSAKADDADVVHNTGNETIAGEKTFTETIKIGNGIDMNGTKVEDLGTPTADTDAATKKYVDDGLATKQDTLTIDATPTDGSDNPVASNGVYDALAAKQDTIGDLATIRSGAAAGATAVQPATMQTEIGNVAFQTGEKVNATKIVNDFTTGGATDVLSAEQGKNLNMSILQLESDVIGNGKYEKNAFTAILPAVRILSGSGIVTLYPNGKYETVSDGNIVVDTTNAEGSTGNLFMYNTGITVDANKSYKIPFSFVSAAFQVGISYVKDVVVDGVTTQEYHSFLISRASATGTTISIQYLKGATQTGYKNYTVESSYSVIGMDVYLYNNTLYFVDSNGNTYSDLGTIDSSIIDFTGRELYFSISKKKAYTVPLYINSYINSNSEVNQLKSRLTALESIKGKITLNPAYQGIAPSALKAKLINRTDDVTIALLGDSITALTNVGSEFDNAANLPAGCQHNAITYMLWYGLNTNKQQCDRFDSEVNAFTETGTWENTDTDAWSNIQNNISGNGGNDYGEYSPDNMLYRASNTVSASVSFAINTADYEKLAFIHRMGANGTSVATFTCTSGKLLVKDSHGNWVELNGFTFSQLLSAIGTNNARWIRNVPIFIKKNPNDTDGSEVTITVTNTANDGYLYYWGTERWNGTTIRIENRARAGRNTGLLNQNFPDELTNNPQIDIVMWQVPLWNELKNTWWKNYKTSHQTLVDTICNTNGKDLVIMFDHTSNINWDADVKNKNLKFRSSSSVEPTTEVTEWEAIMQYYYDIQSYISNVNLTSKASIALLYNELIKFSSVIEIDMRTMLTPTKGSVDIGGGTSGVSEDDASFTTDGTHCSSVGFKFYTNCILPMFYD